MSASVGKARRLTRPTSEPIVAAANLAACVLLNLCDVQSCGEAELRDRVGQFCAFLAGYDDAEAAILIELARLLRGHQTRPAAGIIEAARRLADIAGIQPKQKA